MMTARRACRAKRFGKKAACGLAARSTQSDATPLPRMKSPTRVVRRPGLYRSRRSQNDGPTCSNLDKLSRFAPAVSRLAEPLRRENDATTPSRAETVAKRVGGLSCRDRHPHPVERP